MSYFETGTMSNGLKYPSVPRRLVPGIVGAGAFGKGRSLTPNGTSLCCRFLCRFDAVNTVTRDWLSFAELSEAITIGRSSAPLSLPSMHQYASPRSPGTLSTAGICDTLSPNQEKRDS